MAIAQHHGTARIGDAHVDAGGRSDAAGRGETDRLPSAVLAGHAAPAFLPAASCAPCGEAALPPDLYWQGQADRQREPIALIDTGGQVIRTTPAFDEALRSRDGAGAALLLTGAPVGGGVPGGGISGDGDGRRLRAAIATDQPALDAAIARAVRSVAPVAAATRCLRRDGGAAVIVTLQPLPRSLARSLAQPLARSLVGPGRPTCNCLPRTDAAAATLVLIDPLARPPAATTLWREAFDLTPSEAAVAALLVAGHSLESAAATRGSRATTLRVHLRHLFAKTGTARQADLVALLLRMG